CHTARGTLHYAETDIATGATQWEIESDMGPTVGEDGPYSPRSREAPGPLVFTPGTIVLSRGGALVALSRHDGATLWEREVAPGLLAADRHRVYVVRAEEGLIKVESYALADGRPEVRFSI